jgi:hypothetical protein
MATVVPIAVPMFVIINYKVERNKTGRIKVDRNWRIRFHAKMGPSEHALHLYSIRNTGEFYHGAPIYDAHVFGQAELDLPYEVIKEKHLHMVHHDDEADVKPFPTQPVIVHDDEAKPRATVAASTDVAPKAAAVYDPHYLFYIHGFNSDPTTVFNSCQKYHAEHPRRIVVPVLWADNQYGVLGYLPDKLFNVQPAAKAFARVVNYPDAFPQRSLVCHSMGNFLLRRLARGFAELRNLDEGMQGPCFEDIFMVAADVHDRLFDRWQNRHNDRTKNDGLCVLDLVRRKVYVLHSGRDKALIARVVPNFGSCALGLWGYNKKRLHDEARGKLEERNCDQWNNTGPIHHSYFFQSEQMQYYEDTLSTIP